MLIPKESLDYIKKRAWECEDSLVHRQASGDTVYDYPHFRHKGDFVLDPWRSDYNQNPTIQNPEQYYGWEKMDLFYGEMANHMLDCLPNSRFFLNNPHTPEGWLYIGDDKKARYALGQPGKRNVLIIGLNPSTAVPAKLDPTMTRIQKLSHNLGFDGWIMVNLYPKRTPDPQKLPKTINRPLADANQTIITFIAKSFQIEAVYAAWGTNVEKRKYLLDECRYISDIVGCNNWFSRGITKNGHPRHPLYVDDNCKQEWFDIRTYLRDRL